MTSTITEGAQRVGRRVGNLNTIQKVILMAVVIVVLYFIYIFFSRGYEWNTHSRIKALSERLAELQKSKVEKTKKIKI